MIDHNLSPLAREKLAKAGELSQSEREHIKLSETLTELLSDFFTRKLDIDGLWMALKKMNDEGKPAMVKETQLRLIHTLTLGGNDADAERYCNALLSLETLKEQNRYTDIEYNLNSLKKLRQQYQQDKISKYKSIKESIRAQVISAARQIASQSKNKAPIDLESTIDATARSSPQWRDFSLKFEKTNSQKFEELLSKLKGMV